MRLVNLQTTAWTVKPALDPQNDEDIDRFIARVYENHSCIAVLASGAQVRAQITGCSNQGFNGIIAHLREEGTGAVRQAPIGRVRIWVTR
jgi:hypothetical protein